MLPVRLLLATRAALGPAPALGADDFVLRDEDTTVFLGDSITVARTCGKLVESDNVTRTTRDVFSVAADVGRAKAVAKGRTAPDLEAANGRVAFTRLDGRPFNYGASYPPHYRDLPVPNELNRLLVAVTGLPAGRYEVAAGGRQVGVYAAARLVAGVNLVLAATGLARQAVSLDARIVESWRAVTRLRPYRFVVTPLPPRAAKP